MGWESGAERCFSSKNGHKVSVLFHAGISAKQIWKDFAQSLSRCSTKPEDISRELEVYAH